MTNPNIRAALEAAAKAMCYNIGNDCRNKCASADACQEEWLYSGVAPYGIIAFLRALDRAAIAEQMRERDCHPDDGWNQILSLLVEDAVRHD